MKLRTLLIVGICAIIAHPAETFGQVLLSRYEFNGDFNDSSLPIADNGMVARNGTFIGGTPAFVTGVDGLPGNAIQLDGVDDWIDLTTNGLPSSQTPADGFFSRGPGIVSGTVTAWVKATTPEESEERWLMGSSNSADSQSFRFGWNGARLEAEVQPTDSATPFTVFDGTDDENIDNARWADEAWRHIAVVWRASTGFGTVYIDGVEVATPNDSGSNFNSSNTQTAWEFPMAIGARNNEGTLEGFWEGAVDDLRIYADSLSVSQIQAVIAEVEVAVTPDFDMDNDVDGNDFLIWQRGLGTGTSLAQGDANNSGSVDDIDLTLWQGAYGTTTPGTLPAIQIVPEPSALALLLVAGASCLAGRRRS